MPILYTIDPALNLLYYAAIGDCTGAQFIQAARQSSLDPLRGQDMLIIFDLLSMTDLDWGVSTLIQGTSYLKEWHAQGHAAEKTAVISRSKFASGLLIDFIRMASGLAPFQRVFPRLQSALLWLGLVDSAYQVENIQASFAEPGKSTPVK